jgi:predicted HicB family RNase H-like nuclease
MTKEKESQSEEKKLLIRLPKELHHQARLLAYELNVSMAQLCREGLELVLQKHCKKLGEKK